MATPESVVIDAKGDVVLVCGENIADGETAKVQVASSILTYASPVFAAMLAPKFKEGQILAMQSKVEVKLPEDDGELMSVLCAALHMQPHEFPKMAQPETIRKLAVLCDKYNCAKAAKWMIESWIKRMITSMTVADEEYGHYLTAACVVADEDLIKSVAVEMLLHSEGSVLHTGLQQADIPQNISAAIARTEADIYQQICTCIEAPIEAYLLEPTCSLACCAGEKCAAALSRSLQRVGLWPVHRILAQKLSNIFNNLEHFAPDDPKDAKSCGSFDCCGQPCFKSLYRSTKEYRYIDLKDQFRKTAMLLRQRLRMLVLPKPD